MAQKRDRIVAWVGVIVAALSAVALSGAVIAQQLIDNHNAKQTQAAVSAQTSQAQTCPTTDPISEQALPIPAVYIPSGGVSSLVSTDLTTGSGATVKSGDCAVVKYYGTLASNGKEFDQNYDSTNGFLFTLGAGQVIAGWDKGIVGMKVGGTRRLVIPASLAYGNQSPSNTIPANSALVFVVTLLRIQK